MSEKSFLNILIRNNPGNVVCSLHPRKRMFCKNKFE